MSTGPRLRSKVANTTPVTGVGRSHEPWAHTTVLLAGQCGRISRQAKNTTSSVSQNSKAAVLGKRP